MGRKMVCEGEVGCHFWADEMDRLGIILNYL